MASTIPPILIQIQADVSQLKAGLAQAQNAIKGVDDNVKKASGGMSNFVGNLNCHLIYNIEKNRQLRLQFSRLEGTINITDTFRLKLVGVPFKPVIEDGQTKISRAEYTFDKAINSDMRKVEVRNTESGIILPLGGKDVMLKASVANYCLARKLALGQYSCDYQEIYIDADRRVTVLGLKPSSGKQ